MTSAVAYRPAMGWTWTLRDPVLPERLLSKLWRAKAGAVLRTTDGRRVRVVYPGRPAPGHGPDFRDAVLEIDGVPVRGPVELHRVPSDWLAHGHHDDPAYDGVVLHVVAQAPQAHEGRIQNESTEERTAGHGAGLALAAVEALPTIVLSGNERVRRPAQGLLGELRQLGDEALWTRLTEAGVERFHQRVVVVRQDIEVRGADQTAMMRVMDCLGYAENRKPFLDLAGRVPFAILRGASLTANGSERVPILHRLLLSGAGLTRVGNEWLCFVGTEPMQAAEWRVAGVRPSNHPRRRIAALAIYLASASDAGFVGWLRSAAGGGVRSLLDALAVQGSDGAALVGEARAREVLVNAALPVLAAAGDERAALAMYERAPALPDNTFTREAQGLIGQRGGLRLGACQRQGLLHLYRSALLASG